MELSTNVQLKILFWVASLLGVSHGCYRIAFLPCLQRAKVTMAQMFSSTYYMLQKTTYVPCIINQFSKSTEQEFMSSSKMINRISKRIMEKNQGYKILSFRKQSKITMRIVNLYSWNLHFIIISLISFKY